MGTSIPVLPSAIDGGTNLFVVNKKTERVVYSGQDHKWFLVLNGIRISPIYKSRAEMIAAKIKGFRAETNVPKDQEWLKEVVSAINEQSFAVSTKGHLLEG